MRWWMLAILLTALALAQFAYWNPNYFEGEILFFNLSTLVWFDSYVTDGGHYESLPGVAASPWAPGGRLVEYVYKRAVALFDVPELDARSAVRWRLWSFHGDWIFQEREISITYGLQVAVKLGPGPPVGDMRPTNSYRVFPSGLKGKVWASGPYPEGPEVVILSASYHYLYNGSRALCVDYYRFKQKWWYDWGKSYRYAIYQKGYRDYKCWQAPPPRNITIAALDRRVEIWADGKLIYTYNTATEPWLYTGPYMIDDYLTTAQAFISTIYSADALQPLGRVWLFIGNDTLALPKYVTTHGVFARAMGWNVGYLQASVSFDGVSASVGPGVTRETVVAETPLVDVTLHGESVRVLRGTLLRCRLGEAVADGGVKPFWGGFYIAVGPGSFACTHYAVAVGLFNGTVELVGRAGERAVYKPPDIYLPNGTLLRGRPLEVVFRHGAVYNATYDTLYRVVVKTPLGVNETWLPRGALVTAPPLVDFHNGTRLVLKGAAAVERYTDTGNMSITVTRQVELPLTVRAPTEVEARYERQHLVTLYTPWGVNKTWVREGASYTVTLPEVWEPGNGTRFERLLVNGTEARSFAVEKPLALYAAYGEKYYWVAVRTPVNTTRGWFRPGAVITPPPAIELGNGTRLVDPDPPRVAADAPRDVTVRYRRQYWVSISGVGEEWRGWAYEGSVIRLNETVVGGVRYTPSVPYVEVRGAAAVKVNYTASLYREFRDALGLPNPTATVELCGRRFTADAAGRLYATVETDRECQPIFEAWPLSPYTLAILAAIAVVAAVLAAKRARK